MKNIRIFYKDNYTKGIAEEFIKESLENNKNIELDNIKNIKNINDFYESDEIYICGHINDELLDMSNLYEKAKFICEHCRESFEKDEMINCHDEYICKTCYKEWCMWG